MPPNIQFEKKVEHNKESEREAGKETPIRQIKEIRTFEHVEACLTQEKDMLSPVRQTKQYYTVSLLRNEATFCTSHEEYFFSYCKKYL